MSEPRSDPIGRRRRAIAALELVLENGHWPSGLKLTLKERRVLEDNLGDLREQVRRLEAGKDPWP
jgi:hypothetical protein